MSHRGCDCGGEYPCAYCETEIEIIAPRTPAAPLSEAAGDKVTVMTANDFIILVDDLLAAASDPDDAEECLNQAKAYEAVIFAINDSCDDIAGLRSQVESGMTGRYNPETHRIVVKHENDAMRKVVGAAKAGAEHHGYECDCSLCEALSALWLLSPSPETQEQKL